MKKIGIFMRPGPGHMYPTLPLAKAITRYGGEIVYLGVGASSRIAANEGFAYHCIDLSALELEAQHEFRRFRLGAARRAFRRLIAEGRERFSGLGIDTVLIDPTYQIFAVYVVGTGKSVYYISPFNYPLMGDGIAPIGTTWKPTGRLVGRSVAWILWCRAWLRNRRNRCVSLWSTAEVLASSIYGYSWAMRVLSSQHSIPMRFGLFGELLEFPHLILGPQELDFPARRPNSVYVGPCVDPTRRPSAEAALPSGNGPLVYCSFGSNVAQYVGVEKVWTAMIEVFKRRRDWRLVLQVPSGFPLHSNEINVTIANDVNAFRILESAQCAVIHGGYGTLKECILAQVPVLVIPFKWDQPGNAARVCHFGLGEALIPQRASSAAIERKISALLQNPRPRLSVGHMRDKILSSDPLDRVASRLAAGLPVENDRSNDTRFTQ